MIPLMRAAHLLPIIQILRELGTPVERELANAHLPTYVEETPDMYVGLGLAFDFVARCGRLEGVRNLGYLASQRMQITDFSPDFLHSCQSDVTVHERLQDFICFAGQEDNSVRAGLKEEGCNSRIFCNLDVRDAAVDVRQSEWVQLMALIEIIRSSTRTHWQPTEITFMSTSQPCDGALNQFGNCRILVGQKETSITAPTALLATRVQPLRDVPGVHGSNLGLPVQSMTFVNALQLAITPYLGEGHVPIDLAAEIAGTSVRTLQRKLKCQGLTYSDLQQKACFKTAADLLQDPGLKVIDVAMAVGYEDPSNFTRMFRRFAGLCPREFRRVQMAEATGVLGNCVTSAPPDKWDQAIASA